MTHDPLESLLRLRRLAVDEARRGLADCLRVESLAAHAVAAIESAIDHETDVATDLASGDAVVEAFAAWLRRIRPKQHGVLACWAKPSLRPCGSGWPGRGRLGPGHDVGGQPCLGGAWP